MPAGAEEAVDARGVAAGGTALAASQAFGVKPVDEEPEPGTEVALPKVGVDGWSAGTAA